MSFSMAPSCNRGRERVRGIRKTPVVQVGSDDDAAWVQVIVQGLALTQELRTEDDVPGTGPLANRLGVADPGLWT